MRALVFVAAALAAACTSSHVNADVARRDWVASPRENDPTRDPTAGLVHPTDNAPPPGEATAAPPSGTRLDLAERAFAAILAATAGGWAPLAGVAIEVDETAPFRK